GGEVGGGGGVERGAVGGGGGEGGEAPQELEDGQHAGAEARHRAAADDGQGQADPGAPDVRGRLAGRNRYDADACGRHGTEDDLRTFDSRRGAPHVATEAVMTAPWRRIRRLFGKVLLL